MARFRSTVVYYRIAQLHQKCKGVHGQRGKGRRWMLSGAPPAANIQRIRSGGSGVGSGGLAHGRTRCRAQETRAIFHHYADTMVGLAGSSMFCSFSLLYCPPRPLIFLFHSSCWPCCSLPIPSRCVSSTLFLSLSFFSDIYT